MFVSLHVRPPLCASLRSAVPAFVFPTDALRGREIWSLLPIHRRQTITQQRPTPRSLEANVNVLELFGQHGIREAEDVRLGPVLVRGRAFARGATLSPRRRVALALGTRSRRRTDCRWLLRRACLVLVVVARRRAGRVEERLRDEGHHRSGCCHLESGRWTRQAKAGARGREEKEG